MGISSDAIIAYGYDLGDFDEDPPYDEEEYEDGFADFVEQKLLESVGFTETDWEAEGYYDRKREAENKTPVEIVTHCSYDYPMFVLAIKESVVRAWRGTPKFMDEADFTVGLQWDSKLEQALDVLGLEAGVPRWILASVMG